MVMKRIVLLCVLVGCLAGCGKWQMPPFSTGNHWQLNGNKVVNDRYDMAVNFGGNSVMPIANAGNGDYDLNFVVSQAEYDQYDPRYAHYMRDVLKSLPPCFDSVEVMLADQYMILKTSVAARWQPNLIRRADGAQLVVIHPLESLVQPHDQVWRNLVFNDGMRQIVVVDRLVKNGQHYAIVYVLQGEKKGLPMSGTFQYDIFDRHNIQSLGTHLDALFNISIQAADTILDGEHR